MAFRDHCPALLNKTYFNYGGQGPLPTPSLQAITASWQRIQELGPFTADIWPYIGAELSSTRRRLADLCGIPPHRLSLSENVTSGCVLPLLGLVMVLLYRALFCWGSRDTGAAGMWGGGWALLITPNSTSSTSDPVSSAGGLSLNTTLPSLSLYW